MNLLARPALTATVIGLVASSAIGLMCWSHLRWDETYARGLIQLDHLNQSCHASSHAQLLLAQAHDTNQPADLSRVLADLARARSLSHAMLDGEGRLGDIVLRRPPEPVLNEALRLYEQQLADTEAVLRARADDPERVSESDIRAASLKVDAAALRVEAILLDNISQRRSQQRLLDALTVLLTGFLCLSGLFLVARASIRRQRAFDLIRDSEQRLRAVIEAIPGTSFLLDGAGRYEAIFGHELLGTIPQFEQRAGKTLRDIFPAEQAESMLEPIRETLTTGKPRKLEYTMEAEDGRAHHFEGRLAPLEDRSRVLWLSWDITERKEGALRILKLKRLYEFLSSVNQAIVWSRGNEGLFGTICRTATEVGGFKTVWISWLDEGAGELHSVAHAGVEIDSLRTPLPAGDPSCPVARALREGELQITEQLDAGGPAWAAEAVVAGLPAHVAIPLLDGNRGAGVLNLLDTSINPTDDEEVDLLREVGIDLSYAISLESARQRQRETEGRMRMMAAAIESTQDGVMITTATGRILSVNRAFTHITGYTESEVKGFTPAMLRSGRHDKNFYALMWESLDRIGAWQGEIWNRRKNGEIYAQWMSISIVRQGADEASGDDDRFVAVFTDISQIKNTEDRLRQLAHYDLLTGLPNRSLLNARLEHAIALARRQGHYVAVLFIDLDNFKHVNDALGHSAGDSLLIGVTQRLASRLREQDTLGRLGGDEFLLILEAIATPQDAAQVASALLAALEEPIRIEPGHMLYVRMSIGISIHPDDGNTAAELIRQADTAMYQAKRAGRGTSRFYTEALTAAANYRLELEARLLAAFERNEFSLNFQPLVRLADGATIGAEVLVRLNPPGVDPIGPATFIPLLEETGLIVQLSDWVLRGACRHGRRWLDAGYDFGRLAVNVSPLEIRRGDFRARLLQILAETGFPANRLEIELTESGLMEQGETTDRFLHDIREAGARLSIDDFGTGYSSLAYLRNLPVDKLKIDRSFINDIPANEADSKLAAAIIAMTRSLGITVLAEGVETEAQLDFLRHHGCDACQGYLFSPPLLAGEFESRYLAGSGG